MLRRMRLLEERGVEFSQTPLHALKSFGSDGLVFPAAEAASWPLDRVLRQGFLRPHSARAGAPSPTHVTHRLGLCDERGEVRAVVTQTDVARWLDRALDELPALAAARARDRGLGTGGLIGVRPDTPALEALGLMRSSGVSAVVVRDADGGLVGNFSASDMRSILAEHFGALALPVGEFLAREHGTEYAGYAVQSEEEGDARAKVRGAGGDCLCLFCYKGNKRHAAGSVGVENRAPAGSRPMRHSDAKRGTSHGTHALDPLSLDPRSVHIEPGVSRAEILSARLRGRPRPRHLHVRSQERGSFPFFYGAMCACGVAQCGMPAFWAGLKSLGLLTCRIVVTMPICMRCLHLSSACASECCPRAYRHMHVHAPAATS